MSKHHMIAFCLMVTFFFSLLSGCANSPSSLFEKTTSTESTSPITAESLPAIAENEPKPVKQVGSVPASLRTVVEKNLFRNAVAFEDCLLKTEILEATTETRSMRHLVQMLDITGNMLAGYAFEAEDTYRVTTLTATADGGFLFVLGFTDRAYSQDSWASDNGFSSRVIKCDKAGNLLFDTAFDQIECSALRFCFEKNGKFYLFGTQETPETKKRGVYSPTDIHMAVLDQFGTILQTKYIAGSDYDSLDRAVMTDNGFLLSISAQSRDGDFEGSTSIYPIDWVFTVDDDLQIVDKSKSSGSDYFDNVIGVRANRPLHLSDPILQNFDGGTPTAYVDYGDFYLIVSENATGIYENPPLAINSIWYYWETVYSGYDKNGQLLFRASVDSSPNYDAYVQSLLEN